MKYRSKDNTFKDIYVKTSDTLPTGTVVDYDGTDIPIGWEKVNYTDNIYSSEEVVIGEWFGKPLYRKVIDFGALPNNTTKSVAHNISNVETFTYIKGVGISSGSTIPVPFINRTSTEAISIYCDKTNINILSAANQSAYSNSYITLEYTKTTD